MAFPIFGLGQNFATLELLLYDLCKLVYDGYFFLLTDCQSLFRAALPCYFFIHVQVADFSQNCLVQFCVTALSFKEFSSDVCKTWRPCSLARKTFVGLVGV